MFDQRDIQSLRSAGIDDLGALIGAAADYVRRYPLLDPQSDATSLGDEEREVLRSVGARGLDTDPERVMETERANLRAVVAEYAQIAASAYTAREVAERLEVGLSRVRQLVGRRALYAIEGSAGRLFPRFQFGPAGPLPGLERVLGAIRPDAHPVAVERFFLHSTPDLESELLEGPLCPRDWLLSGNPPEPLLPLAAAV